MLGLSCSLLMAVLLLSPRHRAPPTMRPPSFPLSLISLLLLLSLVLPSTAADDCRVDHKPLSLITFDLSSPRSSTSNVKMDAVESTLTVLSQIKGPVAVVAIAGGYRTGKSWFLNQLLPHSPEGDQLLPQSAGGFTVGHTTEAQTQDVQVHIVPGCALRSVGVTDDSLTVLYMDTPGLVSTDRFKVFDAQLLALLNLISSVVLYNSQQLVDRAAIEQLSNAIETAFLLSFFSSSHQPTDPTSSGVRESRERAALDRPHLIWLIQNFNLLMTESSGRDYLMKKLNQSDHGRTDEANWYTDHFQRFFASIDLVTFPAPTTLTADISKLSSLPWESLTAEYRSVVERVRKEVVAKAYAKNVAGSPMTGELLVDMLRTWIEIMAVKVVDLREQSTEVLFDGIIRRELEKAKATYAAQMAAVQLPVSRAQLKQRSDELVAAITTGKESIPRFVPQVHDMVYEQFDTYNALNEKELDRVSGGELRAITERILDKATVAMKALAIPYEPARLVEIETTMDSEWKAAMVGASEATQSLAAEYDEKWRLKWEDIREHVGKDNVRLSVQLCQERARAITDYYTNRQWWSDWQTEEQFKAQMEALTNTATPLPSHISKDELPCIGVGATYAGLPDQYDYVAHLYNATHRSQVAFVQLLQIVVAGSTAWAATKLGLYWNALGGGSLRAKSVDEKEGINCYMLLGIGMLGMWMAQVAMDGLWSVPLLWTASAFLLLVGALGLRLRWKTHEQVKKRQSEHITA